MKIEVSRDTPVLVTVCIVKNSRTNMPPRIIALICWRGPMW